jgi:hypothetical protein
MIPNRLKDGRMVRILVNLLNLLGITSAILNTC